MKTSTHLPWYFTPKTIDVEYRFYIQHAAHTSTLGEYLK
jgi:hypothetical protein